MGQAVNQFTALGVKSQQADPIAMWRRDHSAIGAETEFFDITSANVGFLDAMSQSEGIARGNRSHWRSFLEFVNTSPLQQGGKKLKLNQYTSLHVTSSSVHMHKNLVDYKKVTIALLDGNKGLSRSALSFQNWPSRCLIKFWKEGISCHLKFRKKLPIYRNFYQYKIGYGLLKC